MSRRMDLAARATPRLAANHWEPRLALDQLRKLDHRRVPSRLRGCTISEHVVAGTTCGVIIPKRALPKGTTLFAHGGAYVAGPSLWQWEFAAQLARGVATTVVVPLYRRAPEDPFPAAFEDLAAIIDILSPDTLVGESSGGGLLTAVTLERGLTSRLVLHSPWLDLDMNRPGLDSTIDPVLSAAGLGDAAGLYTDGLDPADPRLSPIHGDLTRLPRTLLFAGTRDIMLADCRAFRDLATQAGTMIDYAEISGAIHAGTARPGFPEATRAMARTAAFLSPKAA